MSEYLARELAKSMIAILVIDLEYDYVPTHGHTPMRHQIAWIHAVEVLGEQEVLAAVEKHKADVASGKNGAVKTNPIKEAV